VRSGGLATRSNGRPVWRLSPPANHPLRRKGGWDREPRPWRAVDHHEILPRQPPPDRGRRIRARTSRPSRPRPRHSTPCRRRRVATCNRPQTLSTPLECGSGAAGCTSPVARRRDRGAVPCASRRLTAPRLRGLGPLLLISYGMFLMWKGAQDRFGHVCHRNCFQEPERGQPCRPRLGG